MKNRSVVLSDELDSRIVERVTKENKFSDIVRDACDAYLEIDEELLRIAKKYSAGLEVIGMKISPMRVISNLAMSRLAQLQAKREVFGVSDEILREFTEVDGKVIKGYRVIEYVGKKYRDEYEREKMRMLEDEEKQGRPISEEDKKWMKSKRGGRKLFHS